MYEFNTDLEYNADFDSILLDEDFDSEELFAEEIHEYATND